MTTQLRLLSGGELPERATRPRARRPEIMARPKRSTPARLNVRTRLIGQSGVSEARRRLAEIRATSERAHDRAHDLVQAS